MLRTIKLRWDANDRLSAVNVVIRAATAGLQYKFSKVVMTDDQLLDATEVPRSWTS
jgi:hypothetical protein